MKVLLFLRSLSIGSLLFVMPLCFGGLSSCHSIREEREFMHPRWHGLNEDEDKVLKDRCMVTKFGFGRLRFHVTDSQQYLSVDACPKDKKNIVDTKYQAVNWVLTPHFYGSVTKEIFPQTIEAGIKHKYEQQHGLPEPFLDELLAIEKDYYRKEDYKNAIIIISTGCNGQLGVSQSLKDKLKKKKESGEIQDYEIQPSNHAVVLHNQYVQEGKQVFTFIHTTC